MEKPAEATASSQEVTDEDRKILESSASMDDLPVAIPFLGQPKYRDFVANVPGDAGFDPLGLCDSMDKFRSYRDAEIKHARLAMLAAVGWPASELLQPGLAAAWGKRSLLGPDGRAPSVLNGNLFDNAHVDNASFFALFLFAAAFVEVSKPIGAAPGDYGFDPMGLKKMGSPLGIQLPRGRPWMEEAELKNGRLAMIAITVFAFQEFVTQAPVA